jgi:hypothetical protein
MAFRNRPKTLSIPSGSVGTRGSLGVEIVLLPILVFLLSAGAPNPSWVRLWSIKLLSALNLTGATGSTFFYSVNRLRFRNGGIKLLSALSGLTNQNALLWFVSVPGTNGNGLNNPTLPAHKWIFTKSFKKIKSWRT